MARAPSLIAVLGAGTMGAGIAQLGCQAGMRTRLYDPVPEARERGAAGLRGHLERSVERGRLSRAEADAAAGCLEVVDSLDALAGCELVIEAAHGPGFLVNRCGRPFSLEGEGLVEERIATPEAVDRICRLGGGFRMGPFELRDLVGVDVSLEVAKSFYEQSFHEPRWRPS